MRKKTLILLCTLLVTGCVQTNEIDNNPIEYESSFMVSSAVPKVIAKALDKDQYPFKLTIDSKGANQTWEGVQSIDDWKMSTELEGKPLVIQSQNGSLSGQLGDLSLAMTPSMYGLFSPKQHLTLLINQQSDIRKLSGDVLNGSPSYVAVCRTPNSAIEETVHKLLGEQFKLTSEVSTISSDLGVNYVLWFNDQYVLQKLRLIVYDKVDGEEQRLTYEFGESE